MVRCKGDSKQEGNRKDRNAGQSPRYKTRPERRYRRGYAAGIVPAAGAAAAGRAARLRPVPAEPGQGNEPSLARSGSGRRRICRRHETGRPEFLHLSRPCPHTGTRRTGGAGARRIDGPRQWPDARQGRVHAPDLGRAWCDGLLCHHRRASADRLRRRLARAIQGRWRRLGLLLRRRHHQYRRVSRGAEFRRGVEAAGDLRLREQPLYGIHPDRRGDGGAASGRRPRLCLRARAHHRRRQRRRRGLSHRDDRLCQGAQGRRAVADRMHHLSPQRAFARRSGQVSPRGRTGEMERARSDQDLSRTAAGIRYRPGGDERDRERHSAAGRRSDRKVQGLAAAAARHHPYRRLCRRRLRVEKWKCRN